MKVVMYHYISSFNKNFPFFNQLDTSIFKKQIKNLEKKFGIIKSENEIYKNNKKILLTFDDGLKDHLQAAKILKKIKKTGIFFIPTQPFKDKKILNVHKSHLILGKIKPHIALKELKLFIRLNKLKTKINDIEKKNTNLYKKFNKFTNDFNNHQNDNKNKKEFKKIINYLSKDTNIQTKVLDYLLKKFKIKKDIKDIYLSLNEIKKISKMGMIIGSHSHTHKLLSKLSYPEQEYEIKSSKKFLEKLLNKKIKFFCYPYGGEKSYNKNTIKLLKKNKFRNSFSVKSLDVSSKNLKLKPFEISRYDCIEF